MRPIELVVKNYRCFSDGAPLRLAIGSGFTAFIGPNNSGKSTALKLFHELKPLFGSLASITELQKLGNGQQINSAPAGIEDQSEVFNNANDRQVSLEFSVPMPGENELASIRVWMERQQIGSWNGELLAGPAHERVLGGADLSGEQGFILADRGATVLDWEWLRSFSMAVARSLYIGPFRNAISEMSGSYYDLAIGKSFVDLWDQWKTGPIRWQNEIALRVTAQLEKLFDYERLEVNASADKSALQALVDGKSYRLRELGSGLAQFLIVIGNVAIRRPAMLFIDEPELNLHPSLQAIFLTTLASYVADGVAFATHSIGLARTTAERIYSFQRREGALVVAPFAQTPQLPEFLGEMAFSTFRELGFSTILLVEGVSDVKTVQEFLRQLHKDHKVVVVPLGGSQLINARAKHELAELKRLCEDIAVLIDSERTAPDTPLIRDRKEFLGICAALNFRAHATDLRAIENYLPESAIRAVKGDGYRSLQPFEALAEASPTWGKHENWKIAAATATTDILTTDVGEFLSAL